MQTTLLGLAIAIILALLAALVGPLLIDWGGHRSLFEAEASRLIGVDVRVTGEIDARLLPSPQLTLHEIEVGSGSDKIRARSLGIEFALGPLMRGVWRASEMHLIDPRVTLGLDAAGHVQAPNIAFAFDPDGLTIDRLSIENGQVTLTDAANGASVTLDRLWFNGDARSLIGPFKGEGAVTIGGELYPYRIAAGRYGDDGTLKLRVNVDPVNRPLSIEADGVLALAGGAPKFEGSLSLARPVGIASRSAAQAAQTLSQPWRVSGKLKANAQSALMEQVEFQYGSEDRGLSLTGVADFKFGKNPRFDGVLSGRQIDLDRAFAAGDRSLPTAAIRELAELGGAAFRPAIPIQIGVGIDQITLGGGNVQNLRGDISADANGWNLDRFEFRAPGFTQVRLSGHLAVGGDGVAFTGPAEVEAGDLRALAAWMEGRGEIAQGDFRLLSLRGEVTLGSEKIAVERLKAEFDRKPIAGRLVYVFANANTSAKLDAELNAPEIDIDAAYGFGKALLASSAIERLHDMTIAADIGRATMAGFAARNVSARLKVEGDSYQIDRLAIVDLGGAAFSASGRIVNATSSPRGSMRLDLDAPDLTPVMTVLARFVPETARMLSRGAPTMAPAKLHARLTIDGAASATQAKLGIDGSLGKMRLALNGQADADPIAFSLGDGDLRLEAKLDTDDGKALVAMLGLDRLVAANAGPGALSVEASGPARGDLRVDSRLTAGGLEANVSGAARLLADAPSAVLHATIGKADMAPLRGPSGGRATLPVALTTRITLAGNDVSLADINATVAGSLARGKLEYGLARPHRLSGEIEADQVDGAGLVGVAIGMPAPSGNSANASWSSEPFADGAFGDFTGRIALKVRRLDLLPQVTAREFRASLRLGNDEFAFDDMTGDIAGGRFTGRASFRTASNGLQVRTKVSVAGADAASLIRAGARPPITGALGLSVEIEGAGLSPVALIGSLQGTGNISLADAQFAGLDPRAFDAVTRAVDQGLPIDARRISGVVSKALESGQLSIKRAEGTIAVSAGQMRLSNVTADAKDAALSLSGNLDLTDGSLDAWLVLSGSSQAAGARPDIFVALKGPVAAPTRNMDVAALSGWLTLRAIELQAKQLQEIELQAKRLREIELQAKQLREIERAARQFESLPPPPKIEQAPTLPAPVDIRPAPAPLQSGQPAESFGPQN
ncbi:MAG TPA: AsmA-like C-terminal region-containing protein [Pseudolabrys sp.]|nr:AsmA-like C-terminal region-containing protein [Pseudolabrys sp.]